MQVMWKDLHVFLVYNMHLQASSLMTCWIAVAKFYKISLKELVKQKNVCGFFINDWVFQKAHKHHTTGTLLLFRSDVHCSFVIQNEMMDVIYTHDFCHNTTVYHNSITTNIKTQRISGTKRGDGQSSFWPPSWMFLHIQYWRCGIIFTPALFSFSLVSRGDRGCLSKAFFFGSQDLKVCVYRETAL